MAEASGAGVHRTPPLDGRRGRQEPCRPCTWLPWLSLGSVAYSAGRVGLRELQDLHLWKKSRRGTSPRGALGSRRRPWWCAGRPRCSRQVQGRRFASGFLSSSPADCLFQGVVGASWLLPSALTAQRPLGRAPAPLGPLLHPLQVPGVGPGTTPSWSAEREMEAQGGAVGKASSEGLPRALLAAYPALLLLGCRQGPGL